MDVAPTLGRTRCVRLSRALAGSIAFAAALDTAASSQAADIVCLTPAVPGAIYDICSNKLVGTSGNDRIVVGSTLFTSYSIDAGQGDNTVQVSSGNATIIAGGGNNSFVVGSAHATIVAGGGANTVAAGSGGLFATFGSGANSIVAAGGNNSIVVGNGGNLIELGNGTDTIRAGNGSSTISTGGGHDILRFGNGNNSISSGAGNDMMRLGSGVNVITMGSGNDTVLANVVVTRGRAAAAARKKKRNRIDLGRGNDITNVRNGRHDVVDCGPGVDTVKADKKGFDTLIGCEKISYRKWRCASPGSTIPPCRRTVPTG
jgi:Ca2+-binding RTX toxin-like protein